MKALDLVFDASRKDYVDFLCKQSYHTTTLIKITGDKCVCRNTKPGRAWDLTYPSFFLPIEDDNKIRGNFHTTVTNVGESNSTYYVSIDAPASVEIKVEPNALSFAEVGEKQSFSVEVNGQHITLVPIISGAITWTHETYVVRSPLVIYTVLPSVFLNNPLRRKQMSPNQHAQIDITRSENYFLRLLNMSCKPSKYSPDEVQRWWCSASIIS